PLTREETRDYITERLRIAGAVQPVFLPEAADLVYHYSKGIHRVINLLCEHSLVNAYAEQVKPIAEYIVEAVGLELDLVEHPFTISVPAMQSLMNRSSQNNPSNSIAPIMEVANSPEEHEI
ncbi:MAG: hypothetical protein WAN35_05135, partial [Terracidiphilus sp.]